MEDFDNEIVPASLQYSIAPILRVAAEIHERPRVAYLCRFHAFEKAHKLYPNSSDGDVEQFKTSLQQKLQREDASSLAGRVTKTDAWEMESYYKQYYEEYVLALNKRDFADSTQLGKAYETTSLLFEVLCGVNKGQPTSITITSNS